MITDLIVNILGPLAAKRFGFVRKATWVVFAVGLMLVIFRWLIS